MGEVAASSPTTTTLLFLVHLRARCLEMGRRAQLLRNMTLAAALGDLTKSLACERERVRVFCARVSGVTIGIECVCGSVWWAHPFRLWLRRRRLVRSRLHELVGTRLVGFLQGLCGRSRWGCCFKAVAVRTEASLIGARRAAAAVANRCEIAHALTTA